MSLSSHLAAPPSCPLVAPAVLRHLCRCIVSCCATLSSSCHSRQLCCPIMLHRLLSSFCSGCLLHVVLLPYVLRCCLYPLVVLLVWFLLMPPVYLTAVAQQQLRLRGQGRGGAMTMRQSTGHPPGIFPMHVLHFSCIPTTSPTSGGDHNRNHRQTGTTQTTRQTMMRGSSTWPCNARRHKDTMAALA